ncbi:choice-of-anchor D domain-containing protein [Micromonospora sp. KC723]|uniref:choice-of-anchor D domain-containing protein n=1 Tax=Micromonospora sp. KC723 TaxID=2530381 RepID=UPI001049DECA|nr:choice-of-anchor D domain-containing protein [Micromonospora sp. KC723]TDB78519.1 choice-of-anchor D domain-containing protein [Micromonospora sp. KC723]
MRKIRALLGVSVAGACALAGLPGVALAAPTAPYTVVTVDVGDASGHPVKSSGVFDASNSSVEVVPETDGSLSMYLRNLPGGSWLNVRTGAPTGQAWTAGQTYQTARFADSTRARLDIAADHTGCASSTGTMTVAEAGYDPGTKAMTSFAASYVFDCDRTGTMTGEIRWNSDVDYAAVVSTPVPVDFGRLEVESPTQTRTVTYRSQGTLPVTFTSATLTGAQPASFGIVADDCSGRTLAPGDGCELTVSATATRAGTAAANLVVTDDSAYGKRIVPLKFTAFDGVVGTYYPVGPSRLMDTRSGIGTAKAKIGPDRKVDLQVTGRGGVPSSGVGSVVLNVTVANPTSASFLTAYPAGDARPTASSINFPGKWLGSNNVTVKIGSGGKVSIYNRTGYTDVVVDVVGWYAGTNVVATSHGMGGQYHPFVPTRILDTRRGGGVLPGGWSITGWVNFNEPVRSRVRAFVLNITAVSPQRSGFLTAWPGGPEVPVSSTVNYAAGKVVPNLAVVQSAPCYQDFCGDSWGAPSYEIYTSATAHVVVDLVGVIDDGTVADGLRFTPRSPVRIADSRINQGVNGVLPPNSTREVTAPSSVVTDTTQVLAMNVTAVAPTANTVITVWPAGFGAPKPTASNLNPAAGQTVSNAIMGIIGPQDSFHVHNHAGSTHLVADVVGRFHRYSGTASTTVASVRPYSTVVGSGAGPAVRR